MEKGAEGSSSKTRDKNYGILRVDTGPSRRVLTQPSEPSSPQPSVDRLSVSFAPDDKSFSDSAEIQSPPPVPLPENNGDLPDSLIGEGFGSEATQLNLANMTADPEASPTPMIPLGMRLSAAGVADEDDDYSASITAILHRRASTRKVRGLGKRRTSSPFDSDRRRSSVFTTSSGESTAITMEGDGPISQEQIFENIRLHKEVLESVKQQPWEMRRKLKLVQQAKEYIRRHEGQLQERLAQSKSTKDFMARFNLVLGRWWKYLKREGGNLAVNLTPWELRIKEIESHFGSVVASYFTFLRWVFWINIVITAIIICLIIVPEVLAADPTQSGKRKELQEYEKHTSKHLSTLWDFEGVLKYSPMFYGYYTNQPKTKEGYPLPLSYFITGLAVYVYSFVAILRRMAKNSRQSKLSEKEDECIFSWKVFTGWDFMIGNPETAFNRFASITMGFKEALLEEKEKKKDERNWKVISLRVLANLLVLMLLVFSAFSVIEVVKRSEEVENIPDASWWRHNEITLVMTLITTIYPNIFEVIGMLEKYHPRRQLRWQLGRIMVLNFLNLYTLIIALFGKVDKMNTELTRLQENRSTAIPPTIPPYWNYCVDVSVNCTLLQEFRYNQTFKETTEILTFLTTTALMTKYRPNMTGAAGVTSPYFNLGNTTILGGSSTAGRFSQREWWDLFHTLIPNLDKTATTHPDLRQFISEIDDNENLTLFTPLFDWKVNETSAMIPANKTSLKAALPLLFKLIITLIPDRVFIPNTTPATTFNVTPKAVTSTTPEPDPPPSTWIPFEVFNDTSSTWASTSMETSTDGSQGPGPVSSTPRTMTTPPMTTTTISSTNPTTTPRVSTTTKRTRRRRPFDSRRPGRQIFLPRSTTQDLETVTPGGGGEEFTDPDESRYNNLMLTGQNSYQSIITKLSTRGDMPGDVSEDDHTTSTTPIPSSSSTLPPLDDNAEKLLTTIRTMIQLIANHNSSRTDFPNLSTIEEYAKFVTNYHAYAETRLTTDPYNSTFSSTFHRKAEELETNKCYVRACENGTIDPPNFMEYLNCSDLACTMNILVGPRNESMLPACIIPGSRSCITTEAPVTMDPDTTQKLGKLCWETMFGQELVKLTVMDLIFTVGVILVLDFIRAILVRTLNPCWCWDLEKKFPQYGDFKIAENILHLVNNQGMIWMGMFFSPGLPAINLVKLVILMYIRSWTVMTCNVPHETVFRASRSNNFYFALLLFMLFLCVLPVGYAIVWLTPSWHCGPFSGYEKIFHIFTDALKNALPLSMHKVMEYIASPGIVIPLLVLLVLVIYYLLALTGSLREANNDLKVQLRRERTEERRKMFKIAGGKKDKDTPMNRWQAIIPVVKSVTKPGAQKSPSILTTGKQTGFAGFAKRAALKARAQQEDDGNATDVDVDQVSLPEDVVAPAKHTSTTNAAAKARLQQKVSRKPSATDSIASTRSEIPVIKISKDDEGTSSRKPTVPAAAAAAAIEKKPIVPAAATEKKPVIPAAAVTEKKPVPPTAAPTASTAPGSSKTPTVTPVQPAPPPGPSKRERILKALISRSKDKKEPANGGDDKK